MNNKEYQKVLTFWFDELDPKDWWRKSEELDSLIEDKFSKLHEYTNNKELDFTSDSPEVRLAKIIVLDQFSRNIYRDKPESFASDILALNLAQDAVRSGLDMQLSPQRRLFLYMPYMHSEDLAIHDEALILFEKLGFAENLKFEHAHRDIIKRFGRYPHRNAVLGRESTPEEIEFLKEPGSSF